MKIMPKIMLCFITVVLIFGFVMVYLDFQSIEREKSNTIKLYEERGLSIAKALDASIQDESQLTTL